MSQAVNLSETQAAQAAQEALAVLNEAWSYYTPEALPVKDEAEPKVGYVDYYSEAA